jgi:extracellular elastinolytic metalloproteinase
MRDGALENDIVVHENTHGMSNRMTGGGTAACLQTTEAAGLGEGMHKSISNRCLATQRSFSGWSDAVAE